MRGKTTTWNLLTRIYGHVLSFLRLYILTTSKVISRMGHVLSGVQRHCTYLVGKSTSLSILSRHSRFRKEKRLSWMMRVGGRRQMDNCFVASRWALHEGQYLQRPHTHTHQVDKTQHLKPQSHYGLRLLVTNLRPLWTKEPTSLYCKAMATDLLAAILVARFLVQNLQPSCNYFGRKKIDDH